MAEVPCILGANAGWAAQGVYMLCATTSLTCALLLLRAYTRTRLRFLLWSTLCFVGMTVDNAMLFFDLVIVPESDLAGWRSLAALAGLLFLLYGLIWEAE